MKLSSALSLLALAVVPAVSSATSAFTLDFNNIALNAPVVDAYAAQGVSFTNVVSADNTFFSDVNRGAGIAFVVPGNAAYMNVANAVD